MQYHYSTFGGIAYGDPNTANDGYYRGDGDSNTDNPTGAQTSAILTGWPAIAAAAPIGYITIPVPTKEQATVSIVLEHDSAGNVSGAHNQDNPAVHVGPGFASSISSGNLLAAEILIGETYAHTPSGNIGYCVVSGPGTPTAGRYVGTWLPNDLHFDDRAEVAQVLVAVKHDADTSAAQVGQLQQQLKAAQAQDATDAAAATAAEAADATDKAAATKAQADLATAEQTITQLEAQLAQQSNSGEGAALIAELRKALGLS